MNTPSTNRPSLRLSLSPSIPRWPSLVARGLALVAVALAGCTAEPQEVTPEPVSVTAQAFAVARDNCTREAGSFSCRNTVPEAFLNEGSYLLLTELDAWRDQRVRVTNLGEETVTLFVAQGFNKTAGYLPLAPGETKVMARIDEIWPNYALLFDAPAGAARDAVLLEVTVL